MSDVGEAYDHLDGHRCAACGCGVDGDGMCPCGCMEPTCPDCGHCHTPDGCTGPPTRATGGPRAADGSADGVFRGPTMSDRIEQGTESAESGLVPFRRSNRPKSEIRCGTISGWTKHVNLNEKPCDACAAAKREYDADRRKQPEHVLRTRLHARAQGRALKRLKDEHPEDYRRYYETEKAALVAEQARLDQPSEIGTPPGQGADA